MQDEMSRDAMQRMGKCVALLKEHYRKMRTGRANTGLLDGIKVDYYGTEVPINQVASVNVEDSRTLVVSPWDKSAVQAVEKAILKSDLGLTPNTAGHTKPAGNFCHLRLSKLFSLGDGLFDSV